MAAHKLLTILQDGEFHSGQHLSERLGVSRTAIWKQVAKIEKQWAIPIESVRGKGYRLSEPLDLLDEAKIRLFLDTNAKQQLSSLEIFTEIDSTNHYLMQHALQGEVGVKVCLAEQQTQGQGRRGRHWYSPFGRNIYLSLLWQTANPLHRMAGLSLVIGVVVAEVIRRYGFDSIGLKWPNDLVTETGKVGGVLIQIAGEQEGPSRVVIGLGLNMTMPADADQQIDQPWVDMASLGMLPNRSELAAVIINQILQALAEFETTGLENYYPRFSRFDHYMGKDVVLIRGDDEIVGVCRGIGKEGALLLETSTGVERFHGGELSLRRAGRQHDSIVD